MRWFLLVLMMPMAGWAADEPSNLMRACLGDMPRRVGMWQTNGALACSCMFDGKTAWHGDADSRKAQVKEDFLAQLIREGRMGFGTREAMQAEGLAPSESRKLEMMARVYPAVLFQNKAVVQCFNAKCRETEGCETLMNDVSGTAPKN